jgi:hypothetical protein
LPYLFVSCTLCSIVHSRPIVSRAVDFSPLMKNPTAFFFNCPSFVRSCTFVQVSLLCPIVLRAVDFSIMKNPTAFFLFICSCPFYPICSCSLCSIVHSRPNRTAYCGFFHYEKSDGFGRERTRDLGFQRPARKPLDHRSRLGGWPTLPSLPPAF